MGEPFLEGRSDQLQEKQQGSDDDSKTPFVLLARKVVVVEVHVTLTQGTDDITVNPPY